MKVRVIASLVMASCLAVGSANASSIGIFFAPDASSCSGTAAPFTPFFTYIVAVLGGDAAATGITGAEFRADGYDCAWFNTPTPAPASNLSLGNPLCPQPTGNGVNIAFPSCQSGSSVLLFTIQSLALGAVTPRTLSIKQHTVPSNPNFQCALFTLCDQSFSKICVSGGEAFLNQSGAPCTVGVEQKSWSGVKSLYN